MNAPPPAGAPREAIRETPDPLALQGIEFVEYATTRPQALGHRLRPAGRLDDLLRRAVRLCRAAAGPELRRADRGPHPGQPAARSTGSSSSRSSVDIGEQMIPMARELGAKVLLACSSTSQHATGDLDAIARDLRQLGMLALPHGIQVAFEALSVPLPRQMRLRPHA